MKVSVNIIESERGWGQRVDSVKTFEGKNAWIRATNFVTEYNKVNNKTEVPDWYMYAQPPQIIEN